MRHYATRENKCHCLTKDGEGVQHGIWFNLEVVNIPFFSTMIDPFSNDFKNVKATVEHVVSGSGVSLLRVSSLLFTEVEDSWSPLS